MIERIVSKFASKFHKGIAHTKEYYFWSKIPSATLVKEVNLKNFGGCRLFVTDINQDGIKEFLWLQSAGMFKSKIYDDFPGIKNYLDKIGQENVFCLTATDQDGNVLWQIGEPYEGENPYLTHSPEHLLKTGDVNGDGIDEILVFDAADNILVLNPLNGEVIQKIKLPNDSFSILYYIKTGKQPKDFILLVGVMDRSYAPHPYANPWLIIDSNFDIINSQDYIGAGHNVLHEDFNNDGKVELVIGYQLVDTKGDVIWTTDYWKDKEIDSLEQHADYIHAKKINEQWVIAISGSDKQYLLDTNGKTIWEKSLPHPQFSIIGCFKGEPRILVANQREIINSFSLAGDEVWKGMLPEHWPMGKPKLANQKRPIHSSDPLDFIPGKNNTDWLLYKEGGWPFIVDFQGNIVMKFPFTPHAKKKDPTVGFHRLNDIGMAYEGEIVDTDNDGKLEVIIYDRSYLWIYKIDKLNENNNEENV